MLFFGPGTGQVAEILIIVLSRIKVTDGDVIVVATAEYEFLRIHLSLSFSDSPVHLVEEVAKFVVP